MRSRLRTALVVALTIGLLVFFLGGVDLPGVWTATRGADARLLLLAVGITMMSYALRAFRWQYLLAAIGPTHFATAFRTTVIGFAASFLLPARPGEVLRPYLLARREGLPATAAFATVILERLLDLVVVLLLFGVFVMLVNPASLAGDPAMYRRVKAGGLLAAAAAIAGLAVFFVLASGRTAASGHATGNPCVRVCVVAGRNAARVHSVVQRHPRAMAARARDREIIACPRACGRGFRRNLRTGPRGHATAPPTVGFAHTVFSALAVDCGGNLGDLTRVSYDVRLRWFVPRHDPACGGRRDADARADRRIPRDVQDCRDDVLWRS